MKKLVNWSIKPGPFGVPIVVGVRQYTGDWWRATLRAMQGGPGLFSIWTNRGLVQGIGWPREYRLKWTKKELRRGLSRRHTYLLRDR